MVDQQVPHPELLDEHFADDVVIHESFDHPRYDSISDEPCNDALPDEPCYDDKIDEQATIFHLFCEPSIDPFVQDRFIHK